MGNLTLILNSIIALAKILPFLSSFMDSLTELWADNQIKKFEGEKAKLVEKRTALMNAIRDAKTDEDRKALSIMLSDLIRNG